MKRLWLIVAAASCVGFSGCATKGWVTEQINQTRSHFAGQIQKTRQEVNRSMRRMEDKIDANQKAVADQLATMKQEMTGFRRSLEGKLASLGNAIKVVEAKVLAGHAGTLELLSKEKELLKLRLQHIDKTIKQMSGAEELPPPAKPVTVPKATPKDLKPAPK